MLQSSCFGADDWNGEIHVASYEMDGATSVLTLRQLQSRLHRQGTPPFHGESLEDKVTYLTEQTKQLCANHILASMATEEGLYEDVSVRRSVESEKARLAKEALFEAILKDATPPDAAAVEEYYKKHLDDYRRIESFEVQRIFSFCPDMKDEGKRQAALERAEKALAEVMAGADFSQVAVQRSTGPTPNTGEPVLVYPHQLNAAVRQALNGLSPGDISGIVETSRGYLILKVVRLTPAGYRPLDEELRKQIEARLYTDNKEAIWDPFWNRYMAGKNVFLPYKDIHPLDLRDDVILFGWDGAQFTWKDLKQNGGEDNAGQWQSLSDEDFQPRVEEAFKDRIQAYAALDAEFADSEKVKFESSELEVEALASGYLAILLKENSIDVTDQELREYYQENPKIFQSRAETSIAVLKFLPLAGDGTMTSIITPSAKSAAFWKAQEAFRRISKGETFDSLQSDYAGIVEASTDEFRPMGPRGHQLDMAVQGLSIGQVCEPVEVDDGFLLIQVTGIKGPELRPFEEVKEIARLQVSYGKKTEAKERLTSALLDEHRCRVDRENIRLVVECYFERI